MFRQKISYDKELKSKVKFALENEPYTTISQLSIRFGIPKSTLYDWKNEEIANRAFDIKEDIKYLENNDSKVFKNPNTNRPNNLFNPIKQLHDIKIDEFKECSEDLDPEQDLIEDIMPKKYTKPKDPKLKDPKLKKNRKIKTKLKHIEQTVKIKNEINYDDQLILTELWEQYYNNIKESKMIKVKLIKKIYTTYGVKIEFNDI